MQVRIVPDLLTPAADLAAAGARICTSLFDVLAELG